MNMRIYVCLLLVCALTTSSITSSNAFGQQAQTPLSQQDETIRVSTAEVLLDAVVKDKRGRPVPGLAADDFEIYEDGVRQQIRSLRLVKRESDTRPSAVADPASSTGVTAATTPTTPVRAGLDSAPGMSATALVFDRLSPEARAFARDAALSYAGEGSRSDGFVGVFNIDLSLRVAQPYTTDTRLVREAINNSGSRSSSSHASTVDQVQSLATSQEALGAKAAAGVAAASAGGQGNDASGQASAAGAARADQIFAQMTQRSLEVFEMLQRDQQGYATTNALLAVVNSMHRLPGRKAVVFFSEGLAIPPAVQAYFRSVISTANRAGVSIYAVDAAGLRVISGNKAARDEITRLGNLAANRGGDEQTGRPLTMGLERNEDLLRSNPQSGLGQLASETGGFLIADTNNLKDRLRQVDEDLRTYYLLSYVPQNQVYDGRFRQVEVKLKQRSGLDVQARRGYYAINANDASPVLAYEAPALAALSSQPRANAFPVYAGALSFPHATRPGLVPVIVSVPSRSVTFATSSDRKSYTTDFAVVALVRDDKQQVVRKLSNQYQLSGPLGKLEAVRQSEVLFYREAELEPGRYQIETIVYDVPSGKASARTMSVEVPGVDGSKLRLSSVVIIGRVEELSAADKNPNNPLQAGDVLIYPNLGEPLKKATAKRMAFFFTAYPAKGDGAAPKMMIEILQGTRTLAQLQSDLPAPDATGRIQHASALPLDSFQPGTYELRITVRGAQGSVSRSAQFTVEP
ncbi:MAG: VWA domain-containing protein [Acidobacteriota bacterium]|nr:VWA domain-containing protein [Acidobacteriota bacterium]